MSDRIVAVCGGRGFANQVWLEAVLDGEHTRERIRMVLQGGADGADLLAKNWAMRRGIDCATVHANWPILQKAAGPIRNDALALLATEVIAFPGGRGTADMIAKAQRAGKPILEARTITPNDRDTTTGDTSVSPPAREPEPPRIASPARLPGGAQ